MTAKTYLKTTCPHSFKFLLFMTEANLLDQIEVVAMASESDDFDTKKAELAETSGMKVTFPIVEVESGKYMADSDALISYFAEKNGVDWEALPTLKFYKAGLYKAHGNMFKKLRELEGK